MGYLGTKPANSPLTSELIPDGMIATSDIADGAITTAKIANGAVVQADLATGVAGTGPAFSAYASGAQSITTGTATKITLDVESFDTNNNFSSSRFTPTVAGYYYFTGGIMIATTSTSQWIQTSLYKNGTETKRGVSVITGQAGGFPESIASGLLYMNGSTDYVELYAYTNVTIGTNPGALHVYLDGFLARSA